MKKAFTLAELLVTLGIIGVIAALVLPAIRKSTPDRTKVQYLKAYDTISTTVNSLASDSSLYAVCKQTDDEVLCQEYPLLNTDKPVKDGYRDDKYKGDKKFCNLMAAAMNGQNISCANSTYAFNAATFNNYFNNNLSFVTPNGMRWMIVPQIATYTKKFEGRFQADIYVDVDSSKDSPNCIYNQESCKNPDIFKFMVAATGNVVPADPKGKMYIKTRKSMLKDDKEIENHEIETELDANSRIFLYKKCDGTAGTPCEETQEWVNGGCSEK